MSKEEQYKGYFRKGWILHILINGFTLVGIIGLFWNGVVTREPLIFLGTIGVGMVGALADIILCQEYHETGRPRI